MIILNDDEKKQMLETITNEVHSYHRHSPGFEGFPTWGTILVLVEQGFEKYKKAETERLANILYGETE